MSGIFEGMCCATGETHMPPEQKKRRLSHRRWQSELLLQKEKDMKYPSLTAQEMYVQNHYRAEYHKTVSFSKHIASHRPLEPQHKRSLTSILKTSETPTPPSPIGDS